MTTSSHRDAAEREADSALKQETRAALGREYGLSQIREMSQSGDFGTHDVKEIRGLVRHIADRKQEEFGTTHRGQYHVAGAAAILGGLSERVSRWDDLGTPGESVPLYHATPVKEPLDWDDLRPGADGFIHFNTPVPLQKYGGSDRQVIEASVDLDLRDIPSVSDLETWDPQSVAESLSKDGAISQSDVDSVAARQGDGRIDKLREVLVESGVDALKYRNAYESRSSPNEWSIAIVNPRILKPPVSARSREYRGRGKMRY